MSIFGYVGDMFKRLIAAGILFVLIGLGLTSIVLVAALIYFVAEGHL